jgi:hypothetical protein
MSKQVIKQLLVNEIQLPYDILFTIKNFAFIDTVSVHSKHNKDLVNNVIKNTLVSSVTNIVDEFVDLGNIWDDPLNDPWNNDEIFDWGKN